MVDMETFSVVQFFDNNTYEYVREHVTMDEAIKAFKHYTSNVAVKMGIVDRVIITDAGDCVCAEWKKGEGLVFPTPDDIAKSKEQH